MLRRGFAAVLGSNFQISWCGSSTSNRYPSFWLPTCSWIAWFGSEAKGRAAKAEPLQERRMIDRFRLWAKGGEGGSGCFSLKRSRTDRHGKADGGNGGRGGDVILECSNSLWDFSCLQHHSNAKRGSHGVSKNQIGMRGSDKIVEVPVGTVIHLVTGEMPYFLVTKNVTSLDPWDIPDTAEKTPLRYAHANDKKILETLGSTTEYRRASSRDEDGKSPSPQLTFAVYSDVDETRGQENTKREKYKYYDPWSEREFSSVETYEMEMVEEEEHLDKEEEQEEELNFEEEEEDEKPEEIQYCVAELTEPGQRLVVAQGGEGGFGNAYLSKDPRFRKPNKDMDKEISSLRVGKPGTESVLILELKSIADVGLVGMPNAGKSTLLASLSRARPAISDYAFTTLRPNIGKLKFEDFFSVQIADIPGLIKGAHENRGLGHAFLRHIERTKVLAYVIDLAATLNGRKGILPWEQLRDLVLELEYYQQGLSRRPSLVIANKIDEDGAGEMYEELKRRVQGVHLFPACAVLQQGVPELKVGLRKLMDGSQSQFVELSKIVVD